MAPTPTLLPSDSDDRYYGMDDESELERSGGEVFNPDAITFSEEVKSDLESLGIDVGSWIQ